MTCLYYLLFTIFEVFKLCGTDRKFAYVIYKTMAIIVIDGEFGQALDFLLAPVE